MGATFKDYWLRRNRDELEGTRSILLNDVFEFWDKMDQVASHAETQLMFAAEIGFADPNDPLFIPFLDRAIAVCRRAIEENAWAQRDVAWGRWAEPAGRIGYEKGTVFRCLAHARRLKGEPLDLTLLKDAYVELRKQIGDLSEWEGMEESLYLACLLLLEILGPEAAGVQPLPKRKKAQSWVPESYFRAIEEFRKKGPSDATTWKMFAETFDIIRDPKCKRTAHQHQMVRLEWGILICRGKQPAPFIPPPKEVLAAVAR